VSSATAQELEWAKSAGGAGFDLGIGIATDPRGNSYMTGHFSGTATFGAGEANETVLEARAGSDMFVAKYGRTGALLWATSAGGSGIDIGNGIALDPRGNSYVIGQFSGTATFGAGEANETVLEVDAPWEMFVAKYARDGTLLWATSAGGDGIDIGASIATDCHGNSYLSGSFEGTATFGAGEANETVLEGAGQGDGSHLFVAKYARDGTLLWATSADAVGGAIATGPGGNSYVTGSFLGRTATFGAGEANETVLSGSGTGGDVFVAKYARDGTLLWATSAGATNFVQGHAVAVDAGGNSYVTGVFSGVTTFGRGQARETVLSGSGGVDVFVVKYARDGTLLWAKNAGGASSDLAGRISTDPRGNSYVTGSFGRTATFGAGEANETVLSGSGSDDVFVAKYARDGTLLWATSAGGASSDLGIGIATDPRGNSYLTGVVRDTATFGAGEAHETVLNGGASGDVFVAKYGARNDRDQCPNSDPSVMVVLDGNDTGVENVANTEGCTILDLILQASDDAADRTDFIRSVALLTRTLLRDGLITAEEAGILRTAVSQATFPLS
jgi:hypothetical protein